SVEETAAKKSSPVLPIVVLVICFLLGGAVLLADQFMDPLEEPSPEGAVEEDVGTLVDDLRSCPPDMESRSMMLINYLQEARTAQQTKRLKTARYNYSEILLLLRKWQNELRTGTAPPAGNARYAVDDKTNEVYGRVGKYASKRLAGLSGPE